MSALLRRLAASPKSSERKEEATRLLNNGDAHKHQSFNDALEQEYRDKYYAHYGYYPQEG